MKSHRNLIVAATLSAMVSLAPPVKADATADARKTIQAAYDRANSALARKDFKPLIAMHTPDYEMTSQKGKKTSLATLKESIGQIAATAKTIKSATTIQKIALKGNKATVNVKEHGEILLVNPDKPSETAKIIANETSVHTWVKGAKGWLLKKSKTLTSKATMNGQPMPGDE